MTDTRLVLESPLLDGQAVRIRRMEGEESLSRLFSFRLDLLLEAEEPWTHAEIAELQRRPVSLGFDHGEGVIAAEAWIGMLRSIVYVAGAEPRRFSYRAELVPSIWPLTLFRRSRVFQDLSVTQIAERVLKDQGCEPGAHYSLRTTGSYATREYTVQHEETDFDFFSRQLEHDGIFYFFAPGTSQLVLADDNAAFPHCEGHEFVRWIPRLDAGVGLTGLSWEQRIVAQHVVVRDYDWRSPGRLVQGDAPVHAERGRGLQVLFGEHVKSADAPRLATVRGQELALGHEVIEATSSLPHLRPGHRFTLEADASLGSELDGAELVVASVRHRLVQGAPDDPQTVEPYRNTLVLFPHSRAFRPARSTPKPRIDSVVYAIVDGQGGSAAAPVDEQGRYRVLFPFDTMAKPGGRSSRWVRMAQPYSGAGYGMHFPLHVGTQVLVAHVNGDPDRPVIVGSIPNADTMSPVASANATQSAIRTHNGILFELEDDA